ncbi:MAG: aminodeoxychorismate/anthranilate synthase component II [Kangiellaceae bacterium]|nr:aminodeoxychorismate/anthranilate synthase component II [Kangiellaceae bacterium]
MLLIDNYDSFIYNLSYEFLSLGHQVTVCRNDIDYLKLKQLIQQSDAIVLSPGPGNPQNAGHCLQVIKDFHQTVPMLGICLGHQAIIEAFGGKVSHAKSVMHGKTSDIYAGNSELFSGVDKRFQAARYHSLSASYVSEQLKVIAKADDNEVMAVEHLNHSVFGIQFHPESIMSKSGQYLLHNFMRVAAEAIGIEECDHVAVA